MERDCSILVDQTLKHCEELLKNGKLNEIFDCLYTIENETRISGDVISNGRIILAIVEYCYKAQQWNLLAENIIRFSQMPNQSQEIVMKIVQYFKSVIEEMDDVNIKLTLIETLQTISSCSTQSQDYFFSFHDDSLPCPRPDVINEQISSSPTDAMMIKTKEVLQASSLENDNFRQIELDVLDPTFVDALGLKLNFILPVYSQWKKQFDIEDHEEWNFITFIKQLKDEEISIYFTDAILQEAGKWDDEHGYGVIDLIRYSIIDRLENKRQCPLTPFDISRQNQWIDQVCESVRDGELFYMRRLQVYFIDDYLNASNEKDLQNSMTIFKHKSTDEQMFFYHGTTEIHAQSIIARGIHLVTRGSRPDDFGFGFYTTNTFIAALRHAENRAMRTSGEQRPACLIFSISKNEFNDHQIVRLLYEEKEEQLIREKMDENSFNNNNIFQWQMFVYKCLTNDPPLPLIHNKDAIIGPISANLKDITLGYKPIARKGRPIPTQTAIISMKLAYVLLDGLKGVVIWGKKK